MWLNRMALKSHSSLSRRPLCHIVSRVVGNPAFRLRAISSGKRDEMAARVSTKSSRVYQGKSLWVVFTYILSYFHFRPPRLQCR